MKRRSTVLPTLLCLALLTACGSSSADQGSSGAAKGGEGTYTGELAPSATGSVVVYADPATADAPKKIEAYRTAVGSPTQYTYITAEIDNIKGTSPINLHQIDVLDSEGKLVAFSYGFSAVSELQDAIPSGSNTPLYNEGVSLYNELLNGKTTQPGQKQTATFTAKERVVPARVAANVWLEGKPTRVELSKAG